MVDQPLSMPADPISAAYAVLGVRPGATDDELRSAYRRLVKLHHPDHNDGSPESARRFEGIQDAYARVNKQRAAAPASTDARSSGSSSAPRDPAVESRIEQMERDVREAAKAARRAAEAARERARAEARAAAAAGEDGRPSDEELGYYSTDDSLSKILSDARSELSSRFADARENPLARKLEDLFDEFERRDRG